MKNSIALVALFALGSAAAPSRAEISVDFFYDSLAPHGDWIDVADYGYVFHPRDAGRDWRPYTDGQWAYTDAGWTWVSEEPHGWATYHYGRWANVETVGWVWVPGTEWGPAWVSWRRNDRHVGWAPLPPEARFRANVSIGNWADAYFDIGPANYTFVEVRHLGAPRLRTVILPVRENIVYVRETRNITNIIYQNNIVINQGPRYDDVVRVSAEPIRRLRLERRDDIRDVTAATSLRAQVQGDTLAVAAPAVNLTSQAAPKQVSRKVTQARVNRGWTGTSAAPQELERLRATVKQEAQAPADLPAKPKFEREERSTTAAGATPATSTNAAATEKPDSSKPTATTPESPEQKGTATTPDAPNTTRDARRPGSRGGLREETTGKPDSTIPPEAPTTSDRPGRGKATGRTPRDASTAPATPDSPKPETATPDSTKPEAKSETEGRPGRAVRPAGEDIRGRRGAETGKPETPGASATPGSPDPATTGRPESPGRSNPVKRPEAPGRSDQPGRETTTPKAESTTPETPRKETPSTRPERGERPPKANPERSNRPEAATRNESAEKPEPAKRPEPKATPSREERPQAKPERSARPEQAERAAASGAERAKAARSAAVERPQPKAERPEPKAERPQPKAERPEPIAERPASKKPEPKAEASSGGEEKPRGKKKEQYFTSRRVPSASHPSCSL